MTKATDLEEWASSFMTSTGRRKSAVGSQGRIISTDTENRQPEHGGND